MNAADSASDVLVFAGSIRSGSFNRRLATAASAALADAGMSVTHIELADYPLPLYDGDLEGAEGLPQNALRLKALFASHTGLLIACPEYNSSITPLLKNTLDWISRSEEGEPPLAAYRGKVAALVGASPGQLGGLRGLGTVRSILGNLGVWVQPTQLAVPTAHKVLSEDGEVNDDRARRNLGKVAQELADAVHRHG